MSHFKNFGVIQKQSFLKEFDWNKKKYITYLIKFEEYEGLFQLNRCVEHEQALIGAKVIFNINADFTKVTSYRIIGFQEVKKKESVKELIEKRRQARDK